MAIYVEVSFSAKQGVTKPGSNKTENMPSFKQVIGLDADGTWRLAKPMSPHHRFFTRDGRGSWYHDMAGTYVLRDLAGKTIMELRGNDKGSAFYFPENRGFWKGTRYNGQGRWQPSASTMARTWVGLMIKGSVGAAVSGEVGVAGMLSLWPGSSHACLINSTCGRLGAIAGFSGGAALVIATGFSKPADFHGYTSAGLDWALSVGAKIKGVANPKWAKLARLVDGFNDQSVFAEAFMKGSNPKYQALRKELPGMAKTVFSSVMIDHDIKNILVIDVPAAGGGAEVGIYYGWSQTRLMKGV